MQRAHGQAAVLAIILNSGCTQFGPPIQPKPEMPTGYEAPSTPPDAGSTRLILDANGEPASVEEVLTQTSMRARGAYASVDGFAETVRPVCLTPCVADLKPGLHLLRFTSTQVPERQRGVQVQVGNQSKAVRIAFDRIAPKPFAYVLGIVLTSVGPAAIGGGGAMLAAGAVRSEGELTTEQQTGIGFATAGVAALVAGIILVTGNRPVHQLGGTVQIDIPGVP